MRTSEYKAISSLWFGFSFNLCENALEFAVDFKVVYGRYITVIDWILVNAPSAPFSDDDGGRNGDRG